MCHLQKVSSGRFPGYEGEKKYPISLVKFSLQAERETTDEGKNFKNCLPLQPDRCYQTRSTCTVPHERK